MKKLYKVIESNWKQKIEDHEGLSTCKIFRGVTSM